MRVERPTNVAASSRWPVGYAALPALALLESGVAKSDPAIQKAARFVRFHCAALTRTYEISLAILFLDRLGEAQDRPVIRNLALRLVAGQTPLGAWSYQCPVVNEVNEKKVLDFLATKKRDDVPAQLVAPTTRGGRENADNSNTQFAILGLWVARKYKLPLEFPLAYAERRFRWSQGTDGWDYLWYQNFRRGYGSMTTVGLLALAAGRGGAPGNGMGDDKDRPPEDQAITSGLRALAEHMSEPSDKKGSALSGGDFGPKGALNYYFLWSVERIGVLLDLDTIGGRDWYRWGVDLLLPAQRSDGSWAGMGSGGSFVIDTSFALLFLKRSDLLPDLREALKKRLTITDPGASPGEKSPGDSVDPAKSPLPKEKSPGKLLDPVNPGESPLPKKKEARTSKLAPLQGPYLQSMSVSKRLHCTFVEDTIKIVNARRLY